MLKTRTEDRGIAIGERDCWVLIEHLVETKGPSGLPKARWDTLCRRVAMNKWTISQDEMFKAGQTAAPPDIRWELEYRSDMDPDVEDVVKERRLVYQGWIYEIVAANTISYKDGIELLTCGRKRVPS